MQPPSPAMQAIAAQRESWLGHALAQQMPPRQRSVAQLSDVLQAEPGGEPASIPPVAPDVPLEVPPELPPLVPAVALVEPAVATVVPVLPALALPPVEPLLPPLVLPPVDPLPPLVSAPELPVSGPVLMTIPVVPVVPDVSCPPVVAWPVEPPLLSPPEEPALLGPPVEPPPMEPTPVEEVDTAQWPATHSLPVGQSAAAVHSYGYWAAVAGKLQLQPVSASAVPAHNKAASFAFTMSAPRP
jgi:hypothetical protein